MNTIDYAGIERRMVAIAAINVLQPQDLIGMRERIETMIRAAQWPALVIEHTDQAHLDEQIAALRVKLDSAVGQAALAVQDMIEELEEAKETTAHLRCPVCNELVDAEDLIAVDVAERWTDGPLIDFDGKSIAFDYDSGSGDRDGLYYSHGDPGRRGGHAVSVPDGWDWL